MFDFVYTGSSLFGKHKAMNKMLKNENLKSEGVIYVGDEVRDVEAADKVGLKVVSVDWGFNSREFLNQINPGSVVSSVSDLKRLLTTVDTTF